MGPLRNDHVCMALGNLIKFLAGFPHDTTTWDALFDGALLGWVPLPKRLSFPVPDFQVIWETGGAALGRFPAINWKTQKYIVDGCLEFPDEINPKRRTIATIDVEQMESTTISITWGELEMVLLLGAENWNVLALAAIGFAKKGLASILNQETSKWVARRKPAAESFISEAVATLVLTG